VIHYHGGDDSLLLDQSEARDKIRDALPFAIAEPPADWMVQRRNDATTQRRNDATMRHCHATRAVAEADGCVRDDATVVSVRCPVCSHAPPTAGLFGRRRDRGAVPSAALCRATR
jgi:hypothetical protein